METCRRPLPLREQTDLLRPPDPGETRRGKQSLLMRHSREPCIQPMVFFPPVNDNVSAVAKFFFDSLNIKTGIDFIKEYESHEKDGHTNFPQVTAAMLELGNQYSPSDVCDPFTALAGYYLSVAKAINKAGDSFSTKYREVYAAEMSGAPQGGCRQTLYSLHHDLMLHDFYEEILKKDPNYDLLILKENKQGLIEFVSLVIDMAGIEMPSSKLKTDESGRSIEGLRTKVAAKIGDGRLYLQVAGLINEAVRRVEFLEHFEDRLRYGQSMMDKANVAGRRETDGLLEEARLLMTDNNVPKAVLKKNVETLEARLVVAIKKHKIEGIDSPPVTVNAVGEFYHIANPRISGDYVTKFTREGAYIRQIIGVGHYASRFRLRPIDIAFMLGILPKINTTNILSAMGGLSRDAAGHARDTVANTVYVGLSKGISRTKQVVAENAELKRQLNRLKVKPAVSIQAVKGETRNKWISSTKDAGAKYYDKLKRKGTWELVKLVRKLQGINEDADGVVHLSPFNCAPEITGKGFAIHLGVPLLILTFTNLFDPTGYDTRIEAFVDGLKGQKKPKMARKGTIFESAHTS